MHNPTASPGPQHPQALIPQNELARIWRCDPRTIFSLRARGELTAIDVNGRIFFRPQDIDAFIERHRRAQ
jgi:hypothetical protein